MLASQILRLQAILLPQLVVWRWFIIIGIIILTDRGAGMCHSPNVKIRGQPVEMSSLLPPRRSWRSSSAQYTWQIAFYPLSHLIGLVACSFGIIFKKPLPARIRISIVRAGKRLTWVSKNLSQRRRRKERKETIIKLNGHENVPSCVSPRGLIVLALIFSSMES